MSEAEREAEKQFVACVDRLGIDRIERHIFLCADQTKPKCCPQAAGIEAWNYLKQRLKALKLDIPTADRPTCIFRTKANCLRVCEQGPIMVVYPDGVWYRNVTPALIDRIIAEHLLADRIVEEYAFARHPLDETLKARSSPWETSPDGPLSPDPV